MKVFIVCLICFVAVFGDEEEMTDHHKNAHEIMKEASKACVQELKLDPSLVNEKGPSMDDPLNENGCYLACVDKKIGVVTEDGTYSLERMLSFEDTPEKKQRAENAYNAIMKECPLADNKDACKMATCVQKTLEALYLKNEW